MRFNSIVNSIVKQFEVTNRIAPFIEGPPGSGKTAIAKEVGRIMGFDRVVMFYASMRDPVDLLGTPAADDTVTRWRPPEELMCLSQGRNLLILDELTDAERQMQNALCSLIYEGFAGNLVLSKDTYIIGTGNRVKDKSGATRMITKMAGRMRRFTLEDSLEDFGKWWRANHLDPVILSFLNFRPDLLSAFDPNADSSPTPRTWEFAALTPTDLPPVDYMENIAGNVGEGAAAEYVGFRKVWESLPDLTTAIKNPTTTPVPDKPDVAYATMGALARLVTPQTFENATTYADRFSPDMAVMFMSDVLAKHPALQSTTTFINFIARHHEVMF